MADSDNETKKVVEETNEAENTLWETLNDPEVDSLTTVWLCDMSFDLPDKGRVRDVFACTTKEKLLNRMFAIVASPDLKEPMDFDADKYTTQTDAIKAFFVGHESRDLFVGLIPVV